MTQYFKLTPITTKPEKEGWYDVKHDDITGVHQCEFKNGEWISRYKEHMISWLQPLPSSSLVIEEEKLRETIKKAFIAGNDEKLFTLPNTQFLNQLISDLKEQQG